MRNFIIAAILVLSITCLFGGMSGPKSSMGVQVHETSIQANDKYSTELGDATFGEVEIVDEERPNKYITRVIEKDGDRTSNFGFSGAE